MKISRETRIGIFIVAVLLAAFSVINYLRGEDIFGKEMDINSHYENVEGLVPSNPVYIKGYKAGSVTKVNYNPETEEFDVTCSVLKKIAIPIDSKMTIYSVDLMGGKGIRIDLGTSEEIAENGAELSPSYAPDMVSSLTNMIGPLIERANGALDSLTAASGSLDRVLRGVDENSLKVTLSHLQKTLDNTRRLSGTLADHSEDFDALIANLKETSVRLNTVLVKADTAMTGIQTAAGELGRADIEGLAKSLRTLVDNLNDPDGTLGKLTKDPAVYNSIDTVLKDIDSLVKKIEENPKKYIRIKVF